MTARDLLQIYERMGKPVPEIFRAPSANKFNATKKEVNGILFPSAGEARCWQLLLLQERAGVITQLERQPVYLLLDKFTDSSGIRQRAMRFKPDFRCVRGGRTVCIEFKGVRTEAYLMRRKLFLAKYPEILFEEWRKEDLARL